ncbi:MAG: hypothetical protein PHG85_02065 [Candidatus Altiarchaeota archaeon]|nr:hypothetical protein [Candidatus Altiarchaeota archaeon]
MGILTKAFFACMTISVSLMYLLGTLYIDETYSERIKSMELQLAAYDSRYQELNAQKNTLEAISKALMMDVAAQETPKTQSTAKNTKSTTSIQKGTSSTVKTTTTLETTTTTEETTTTTTIISPKPKPRVTRAS